MTIWALGDLHLSFGTPNKEMDFFGSNWARHYDKIKANWQQLIGQEDLVLLPGDISWAMHPEEAKIDLEWIHSLPGTKVMIRGNHDYWWSSLKKVESVLPPSIHLIQNNVFLWNDVAVGGARLWDSVEYSFNPYVEYKSNPRENTLTKVEDPAEAQKIFDRELGRLEMSLKQLPKDSKVKIVMTHYPPVGADLHRSKVSELLEKYGVSICVFGHLHNVRQGSLPFGTKDGIRYILTSCDYLNFCPIKVL